MFDPLAIFRALATLGAAVIVGTSTLLWYSRGALAPAGGATWRRRAVLAVFVASVVGVTGTLISVAGSAAAAAGTSVFSIDASVIITFLTKTGVGQITMIEIACAAAACVPAAIAWTSVKAPSLSDKALICAAFIAGVGLIIYPFNSHPVTLEQFVLGVLSSIAHRLALAVWVGGLPALILLIGLGPVAEDSRQLTAVVLRHFSRLATAAMVVILASGTLLTWFLVRNFPSLIGTQYGYLLIVKLALLGGVLAIAQGLQRKLLPMLELKPGDSIIKSYASRVKFETLLAVLIVVVASDMAGLAPPEHENIYWPLPFRFSLAATWPVPWVPTRVFGGAVLILAGIATIAVRLAPAMKPAWFRLGANASLAAGAVAAVAGGALAFPAISVQAYPDTYLTTEIPFSVTSIAAGLKHYEDNCTPCHGTSGHGDGPLAADMPINQKPADLSAPHTALHTAGDLYWWITHGITGTPMPGFEDALTYDDRWDIINFLGAFAVGYQARTIEPKVFPGQYWLGPPDFLVTDESGTSKLLSDYQLNSGFLVVLLSCAEESLVQEKARLEQLLDAKERLAALGTKIILVAPGAACGPLRELATGKIMIAERDSADIAASLGLYTRSFHNRKMDVVRVPAVHAEFLIDRSGYIRARWLPDEDDKWRDISFVETQISLLRREPPHPPPPDIHSQH
jgi:putative copper export protein/mono/diheme cytochrome c family protein